MDLLLGVVDVFLHVDLYLNQMVVFLGPWVYVMLFMIIFSETGFVVTPFLPGDSLLFACGALAALDGSPLSVHFLFALLITAAILGNTANYSIGYWVGPRVFHSEKSWLFNKTYLLRTQKFYARHGGKTIIITRFLPILRTFAPFVAGIGKMTYKRFTAYNALGGISWVASFLYAGFYLGNIPSVKRNFHIIIAIIIIISVMPAVVQFIQLRREHRKAC